MSFVTHLESALDGTHFKAGEIHTLHKGRPLVVRYDLPAIKAAVTKQDLKNREPTLWRYRELLPVRLDENIVSLGEGMTPLLTCRRLAESLRFQGLLQIKDESQLPTGSFKSRGMAMAVSMAKELGIKRLALPSAGNAGGAAAAYGARAGMESVTVFMPSDTPVINQYESVLYGAQTYLVENALINDCGKLVAEGKAHGIDWFDLSTLKEPYRLEGKKTMGLELAEQCNWKLPDVILYPTGGGTGLLGMHKAFQELQALGWLDQSSKLPRFVAVQSEGCCPIVTAFDANEIFATLHKDAATCASGIRVPAAVSDFMILDVLRNGGGKAVRVAEDSIRPQMQRCMSLEGIAMGPEAAACVTAFEDLLAQGWIKPDEHAVIFNTGAVQKYVECMQCELPRIDYQQQAIEWESLKKTL